MKLKLSQYQGILRQTPYLIERKFNDLSDKVEKRMHNIEDQIIDMQLPNLSGNNISGKAVASESFFICRYP